MNRRSSSRSNVRRWHRLVERYTPDGVFGRILLGAVSGTFGGLLLTVAIIALFATSPLWFFVVPIAGGLGLGASILTIVTLWPVYLSLIGNVESAKAYPQKSSAYSSAAPSRSDSPDESEPMAVLKREYAAGNITESEFERRLETLLDVEDQSQNERTSHRQNVEDGIRETEPN